MTVEILRFVGLMVKEKSLREEVFGSRFFYQDLNRGDVRNTEPIMTEKEESDLKLVRIKVALLYSCKNWLSR